MSIPLNTSARATYIGNGIANQYTFPFRAIEANDIEVSVWFPSDDEIPKVTLVRDTDYTVTFKPFPLLGGSITLIDAAQDWVNAIGNLKTDWTLRVQYVVRGRQITKYRDLGPYHPVEIEKSYDKLTMDVIALAQRLGDNEVQTEQNRIDIEELQEGLEAIESGGLFPAGGDEGAVVVRNTASPNGLMWDAMAFAGFSGRFNEDFQSLNLRDTLAKIIDLVYASPLVTLSGSSNVLREKGVTVSGITLSANVTKRSDLIARILFRQGASVIADFDPPVITGSGVTQTAYGLTFADTLTFTVEVTDDGTSGGPTTVQSTTTYNFVYPYYRGTGVPGLGAVAVSGLIKEVITSNSNLTRSFTTLAGDVYYFAYPAAYGALTSILDENNFEVIGSWTLRTENITGLDGIPVSYRIYEFNNPVTAGTTQFTFRR